MSEHVTLNALKTFHCLAGDCPDSCCVATWDIDVTDDTYEMWRALPEGTFRDALLARTHTKERRGKPLRVLAKDAAGKCLNFTDEGLCSIQGQRGADYLPLTCKNYPRLQLESAHMRLSSAALSCPEIVRLTLFGGGAQQSTFSTESPGTSALHTGLDVEGHIRDQLQRLTTRVLDERKFPLNVKIYYLGKALVNLSVQSMEGRLNDRTLAEVANTCRNDLFDLNIAIKNRRIRPQEYTDGSFWDTIYDLGKNHHIFDDGQRDCALIRAFDDDHRDKAHRYADIHRQIGHHRDVARPHIRSHLDAAFTNYLRARFMNTGFPWNPVTGNYIAAFINCIIPFALIQLRLWIAVNDMGVLTQDTVRDIVYKTERGLGHSTLLYDHLAKHNEMLHLDQYLDCLVDIY